MSLFNIFKKSKAEGQPGYDAKALVQNEPALQFVSLFFETKPEIDKKKILAELKKRFRQVETTGDDSALTFFFPDYTTVFSAGRVAAQGLVMVSEAGINPDRFTNAFQQSWHWNEAEAVLENCKYEVNLIDMMSKGLPHQARLDFFQRFLCAVLKATEPLAVYFRNSEKLIEPFDMLQACDDEQPAFLHGAMSVRLFTVGNSEMLMDTLGLHAYGLPDIECRFSNYEPGAIARVLTDLAYDVFETGDAIGGNTTVQGIGANPKWKTQLTDAKTTPARLVMSIEPN